MRTAFRGRWLPRHLLMLVIVAALSLLGRWQWDVSQSQRGAIQNFLYAFQWWAMAMMVIYGWWRLLRDDAHPRAAVGGAASGLAGVSQPAQEFPADAIADDSWNPRRRRTTAELIEAQHAAAREAGEDADDLDALDEYNEYLARLNARAENTR